MTKGVSCGFLCRAVRHGMGGHSHSCPTSKTGDLLRSTVSATSCTAAAATLSRCAPLPDCFISLQSIRLLAVQLYMYLMLAAKNNRQKTACGFAFQNFSRPVTLQDLPYPKEMYAALALTDPDYPGSCGRCYEV